MDFGIFTDLCNHKHSQFSSLQKETWCLSYQLAPSLRSCNNRRAALPPAPHIIHNNFSILELHYVCRFRINKSQWYKYLKLIVLNQVEPQASSASFLWGQPHQPLNRDGLCREVDLAKCINEQMLKSPIITVESFISLSDSISFCSIDSDGLPLSA